MLQFLLGILAGLVGLAVLAIVVGLLLSRDHRAASRIILHQSPERVWSVIANTAGVPGWWPAVVACRELDGEFGSFQWEQTTKGGDRMVIDLVELKPPQRLRSVIVSPPGAAFGGEWLYELAPNADGTTLTITETGWIANPLFRTIMALMGHHRTIDSYLGALAIHLGEAEGPSHVR